ncbi:hypothetical protein PC116_g31698 [Phytophthora cactorum]|nr:hypothetical protein PC116_g31698 [Phytophthora cactorum]
MDNVLRTHARIILYGDDDPLNHTPADNDESLTLFKQDYGLLPISPPQVESREADNAMQVSPDSVRALLSIPFTEERMQQAAPVEF